MNNLAALITLMTAMSVAVERVVEILKGIINPLATPWSGNAEGLRRAILQILAALVGAVIAWQAQPQITGLMPAISAEKIGWTSYVLLGLLASGGSGLWNHALDIIQATKINKEAALPKA